MSHTANTHVNSLPVNASLQVSGTSSVGSFSTINQQPQNAYIRSIDRLPREGNNSLPCTIQTLTSQGVNDSERVVERSVLQAINKHEGKRGKIIFTSKEFDVLELILFSFIYIPIQFIAA